MPGGASERTPGQVCLQAGHALCPDVCPVQRALRQLQAVARLQQHVSTDLGQVEGDRPVGRHQHLVVGVPVLAVVVMRPIAPGMGVEPLGARKRHRRRAKRLETLGVELQQRGALHEVDHAEARGEAGAARGRRRLRRGRRDPETVTYGEAMDFWRVTGIEPDQRLELRAEMKLPGEAWLQFEANGSNDGSTELVQTAYFASKGLSGLLYWYGIYPLHGVIFSRMIDAIARKACEYSQASLSVG